MPALSNAILSTDRRPFGRALWLFGDSIFQGFALGAFVDKRAVEPAARDPLWLFRSPAAMINLFLSDMGLLSFDNAGKPLQGDYVAIFLGSTGLPDRPSEGVIRVKRAAKHGLIKPGDTLAFLDAGPHFGDPARHEAAWTDVRRAAGMTAARALMCTVFDNLAQDRRRSAGGLPTARCMHDIKWEGGRSHNDALRAAVANNAIPGDARLVEMSSIIALWHDQMLRRYGVPAYLPDNVHLNVWGQLRLSWVLFSCVWPDLAARAVLTSTEALVRGAWARLGYGTRKRGWSAETAVEAVRSCTSVVSKDFEIPPVESA